MPIVTQGSPATLNVNTGQFVVVNATTAELYSVEAVSGLGQRAGTKIVTRRGRSSVGPFEASGSLKVTLLEGASIRSTVSDATERQAAQVLSQDPLTGAVTLANGARAFVSRSITYVPALHQSYFAASQKQRSRLVTSGQMPGVPRYDLTSAYVPYGTDTAAFNNATSAASTVADPDKRIVNITRDMTIGTVVIPAGVKIVSENGSKLTMGGGYMQANDYNDFVGLEIIEGQIRSNTTSAIAPRIYGCLFNNTTVSPGANVGAIRLTGSAHYARVLWNEVRCNDGNAQGIIFDLGKFNYVADNKVIGVEDRDRLISFCGTDGLVERNWLVGGLTGITGLVSRSIGSYMARCVVRHNWIFNVTEEGLGVDSSSNSSLIAALDRVTVTGKTSTTAGTPGLTFARAASADITANTYWAMILKCAADPTMEGNGYPIVSASGTTTVTITLPTRGLSDAEFNAIGTAGTIIGIQLQCPDNVFANNYIVGTLESPMNVFGVGYRCTFRDNIIDRSSLSLRSAFLFQQAVQCTCISGIASSSATVATGSNCAVVATRNRFYNNRTLLEKGGGRDTPIRFVSMSYGGDPSSYLGAMKAEVDANSQAHDVEYIRSTQTPPAFTTTSDGYTVTDVGGLAAEDSDYAWIDQSKPEEIIRTQIRTQRSFTGNASTTVFTLPHTLGVTPRIVNVTPMNAIATPVTTLASTPSSATPLAVTVDASNVTLTYGTAPGSGTGIVSVVLDV